MQRVDSLEKTLMLEGIGGRRRRGTTEDEMAGWHHRLNGHEFGWTPGVGDGQGGLACCNSWGHRVGHDWSTELNWTEVKYNPGRCHKTEILQCSRFLFMNIQVGVRTKVFEHFWWRHITKLRKLQSSLMEAWCYRNLRKGQSVHLSKAVGSRTERMRPHLL